MKKTVILLVVACLMCPLNITADDHFFIYLCFGQTNMVGHGNVEQAEHVDVEDFYNLSTISGCKERKLGTWYKAVPPLCGPDCGTSFVEYFGYTLRRNLPKNIKIGVVCVAVDDCELDLFDKDRCLQYVKSGLSERVKEQIMAYGGNPYERLVKMGKEAKKQGVIRGILMHHGETDHCDEQWLRQVGKIYQNLIQDLGLDAKKVPLVVGETVDEEHKGKYAASNAVIRRLPQVVPQAYVASSKECGASTDHVHFSNKGYYLLGMRYGLQILKAMGMGFEDSEGYYDVRMEKTNMEFVDVDGRLDKDGIFHAKATMPITKVNLLTYSGTPFKSIAINGATTMDIDTTVFPDNQYPFMEFIGENGSSVTVEVR